MQFELRQVCSNRTCTSVATRSICHAVCPQCTAAARACPASWLQSAPAVTNNNSVHVANKQTPIPFTSDKHASSLVIHCTASAVKLCVYIHNDKDITFYCLWKKWQNYEIVTIRVCLLLNKTTSKVVECGVKFSGSIRSGQPFRRPIHLFWTPLCVR